MVICVIALVVFGVLGIFSARYRALAAEAFDCVFRKVTLRPCATNLNQRVRAKIVAKLFTRSPKAAGIVRRNFEPLSWAFTILMLGSAVLTAEAGYNIWKYGTCTPSNPGECVFVPTTATNVTTTGANPATSCGSERCATKGCSCDNGTIRCAPPEFKACAGNCTCKVGTCG